MKLLVFTRNFQTHLQSHSALLSLVPVGVLPVCVCVCVCLPTKSSLHTVDLGNVSVDALTTSKRSLAALVPARTTILGRG